MSVVEIDCEDFLSLVYGERVGWIDLPARVGQYWVPFYHEWGEDEEATITRRIDSSIRDEEDLYYSVAQFSRRGRRIEDVLPSSWLWADLDETHPTEAAKLGFLPTIAVESSPGRFQGLWRLDRALRPKTTERLNRALTYALSADRGGWDLTQVLRLPGTRNFKYPDAPRVELLWHRPDVSYDPKEVWEAVKSQVDFAELRSALTAVLPSRPISAKARQLLRTSSEAVVTGERSARLWELNCLLAEVGLDEDSIYDLVVVSAWNKWRGQASGSAQLRRDIRKAIGHVSRQAVRKKEKPEAIEADENGSENERPDSAASLPFVGYSSFMAMTMPEGKWLVRDIWTAGSHGIIGGEPKTSKTTLALALALSVASGKAFLGEYPVGVTGGVLFVQEENAPWMMQDRLRKLAAYYGLLKTEETYVQRSGAGALGKYSVSIDFPVDVPLRILNNYGFDLAVEEHREMLIAEIEELRPKLLVLDPLYLMFGGTNENNSSELRPFLKWLLGVRYSYDCAIAVVHHMRKQNANSPQVRAGQRILGSATLHGWVDSALYASHEVARGEGWIKTTVEREFRAMAPQRPITIEMNMGSPGSLDMVAGVTAYDLGGDITKAVNAEPGISLKKLSEQFGISSKILQTRCVALGLRVTKGGKGRGNTTRVYPES